MKAHLWPILKNSDVQDVKPPAPSGPGPGPRTIALCQTRTPVEREICARWVRSQFFDAVCWSPGEVITVAEPDHQVVPIRVVWSGGAGRRSWRRLLGDLVGGPLLAFQQRGLAQSPGSYRILQGEPALRAELHSRWLERYDSSAEGLTFEEFIELQAQIALDRVEHTSDGRYRAPRAVVTEVLSSPGFRDAARALSVRVDRDLDGVLADARAYLDEMASEQHRFVVDIWARWAKYLYSRGFTLKVDQASLERVRKLGAEHPLVFLPSHRSNLDPYVITSLLYEQGLPQNHTLGGINMAFWPIGPLGRRVGVVFIRRSFRDNEIYQFVLKRYLSFLVGKRFNLEWYLEGTRSRTGKLMPPRLGLVNWLIDAVDTLDRGDVYAVPTSIVYDLLPEATELTEESRGLVKSAEGLGWFLRYARRQRGDFGAIHVTFGEPLNLRETLRSLTADDTAPGDASARQLARSKIAFEVCARINNATLVTAPALLLFTLLGVENRALEVRELYEAAQPILTYAEVRDVPLDDAARALATEEGVSATLRQLTSHRLVECFADGEEPVYRLSADKELLGAFYRNSIIHWFVSRAIVELIVLDVDRFPPGAETATGWLEALRLRDLLKFEFFFQDKAKFSADLTAEMARIAPDWQTRRIGHIDEVRTELMQSGLLVAHRTLRSFIEAYGVVAHHLVALGTRPTDAEAIVQACLPLGRQFRLQQRVTSSEAISAHLFRTAVKLAIHRNLLTDDPDVFLRRRAFAAELDDVLRRLSLIHDLERSLNATDGPRDSHVRTR